MIKFIEEYNKAGIPIHAITVQNEPLHDNKNMPTCVWRGEEEREFIELHLGPKLETLEIDQRPDIWCYDHNWEDYTLNVPAKYPQIILDSPLARKYVKGIAFHHYSNFGYLGKYRGDPSLMKYFRKKYPEVPLYFTEGSVFGLRGATFLCKYLKMGSSSYNGWVPFLDMKGKPNNGPFKATSTFVQLDRKHSDVAYNFDYYMYGHFSKFIADGSLIVRSTGKIKEGCEYCVIRNIKTNSVSIICVNNLDSTQQFDIQSEKERFRLQVPSESIITLTLTS